jgi:hypothetical protein
MNNKCICKVCGKEYNHKRGNGSSKDVCPTCRQDYRKKTLKHRAIEYKGGRCNRCGYDKNASALVFHHIDPKEKEFQIGEHYNYSWDRIKKELDKCEMLCANCHHEEHSHNQHSLEEYQKWIRPQAQIRENAKKRKNEEEQKRAILMAEYKIDENAMKNVRLGGRKIKRPTKEAFFEEYNSVNHNKSEMGRRYGVSSKSIEKWIKSYEKYGI